jgi:hypothetical protein
MNRYIPLYNKEFGVEPSVFIFLNLPNCLLPRWGDLFAEIYWGDMLAAGDKPPDFTFWGTSTRLKKGQPQWMPVHEI